MRRKSMIVIDPSRAAARVRHFNRSFSPTQDLIHRLRRTVSAGRISALYDGLRDALDEVELFQVARLRARPPGALTRLLATASLLAVSAGAACAGEDQPPKPQDAATEVLLQKLQAMEQRIQTLE